MNYTTLTINLLVPMFKTLKKARAAQHLVGPAEARAARKIKPHKIQGTSWAKMNTGGESAWGA